jgi:hypothetical protein
VIEGVVVSHTGNHAFVPHESHGVSFTDCISYDTFDEAYWWDEEDSTHDVSWIGCVAAHVRVDPDFRGFRLTGFLLGRGQNVSAVGCVAVGVLGNEESSGFRWPELPNGTEGVWDFRNCVAHNNSRNGIFTWQNTSQPGHVIDGFTAYRNGFAGIDHGAYENKYRYQRTTLFENNLGVLCHADSKAAAGPDDGLVFADINIIALDVGIELTGTNGTPAHPVLFRDMTIQAPTPLRIEADKGEGARIDRFERCGLEPEEVDFVAARSGSEFTFVRADGSSWTLDSNGTTSS